MALTDINKSVTFTARSVVNDDIVAYMNASVMSNGEITKNYNIHNKDLYKANKTVVEEDFAEFSEAVDDLADIV